LYWYDSSLKGYDTRPSITKAVPLATEEIRAKAEGFDLGVTTVPVHSFIAERYAQSEHPGLYITSIAEGSAAEKAKLKPKDIIWKVNKLTWKGHPDLLTEAGALLADGETVTIGVIRDGKAKNIKVKGKTSE
ncbi:MAG: PDZ domain-containing protein, partial [Lachnospiraceae bacterium]|nr:PDZ domain-containing protein [Lachnospiraceae bacterium]